MAPRRQAPSLVAQLSLLLLGGLSGVLGTQLWQRHAPTSAPAPSTADSDDDGSTGQFIRVAQNLMKRAGPSRIIYLNREGAQLRGGPDDATLNMSSVVGSAGTGSATLPAFAGTPSRWRAIAECIRSKFSPFDVQVVEQRPLADDYIMVMMGGTAKDIGYKSDDGHDHVHAMGLSPFNSEAIPNAVVFVFTRALRERLRSSCEVAGMEIAHAYGLDHSRHCKDLMTYKRPCGARSFLDRDVPCGEQKDRACANGDTTQNSFAHLMTVLGAVKTVVAAGQ